MLPVEVQWERRTVTSRGHLQTSECRLRCGACRCPTREWCWNLDDAWPATARLPLPAPQRGQRPLRAARSPYLTVPAVRRCGLLGHREAVGAAGSRPLERDAPQLQWDLQHQPAGPQLLPAGVRGCHRRRDPGWCSEATMGFYRGFLFCWNCGVDYRWVIYSAFTDFTDLCVHLDAGMCHLNTCCETCISPFHTKIKCMAKLM